MERLKTCVGHSLDFSPPTYCFLLVSIRRPFYSSHRRDSSARGTGPLWRVDSWLGDWSCAQSASIGQFPFSNPAVPLGGKGCLKV